MVIRGGNIYLALVLSLNSSLHKTGALAHIQILGLGASIPVWPNAYSHVQGQPTQLYGCAPR